MRKNTLAIKCTDAFQQIDWVILSSRKIIQSKEKDTFLNLIETLNMNDYHIHIHIQSSLVTIRYLKLPPVNSYKLSKMLPSLFEEDLLEPVEKIYFTHKKVNENHIVAMLNKDSLNLWLNKLKEYHIDPKVIVPFCLDLPFEKGEWHLWIEDPISSVKTDFGMGFSIEKNELYNTLYFFFKHAIEKPNAIIIHHGEFPDKKVHPEIDSLFKNQPSNWYAALPFEINLLANHSSREKSTIQFKSFAYHTTMIFLLTVLFLLTFEAFPLWKNYQTLNDINQQIEVSYKKIYPTISNFSEAQLKITKDLKNYGDFENSFLSLFYDIAIIIKRYPSLKIQKLNFKNNQLNLLIQTTNNHDLEAFISSLKQQLKVNEMRKKNTNNTIISQLTISKEVLK